MEEYKFHFGVLSHGESRTEDSVLFYVVFHSKMGIKERIPLVIQVTLISQLTFSSVDTTEEKSQEEKAKEE